MTYLIYVKSVQNHVQNHFFAENLYKCIRHECILKFIVSVVSKMTEKYSIIPNARLTKHLLLLGALVPKIVA